MAMNRARGRDRGQVDTGRRKVVKLIAAGGAGLITSPWVFQAARAGGRLAMDTFHEGQKVWVEQPDGSQRPAIFVGEAEASWFGGSPGACGPCQRK